MAKCCACEDLRPLPSEGEGYEGYVDGIGFTNNAARDDGYSSICNTKNYVRWERMQADLERKRVEDKNLERIERERKQAAERDRQNNRDKDEGTVQYSNGDVYVGSLRDGNPHGRGRMDYSDDDENDNALYYDGEWVNGKHEGKGKKMWWNNMWDNIWYEGEWRGGMMHGDGTHHLDEADVRKGRFEEDVFCDE